MEHRLLTKLGVSDDYMGTFERCVNEGDSGDYMLVTLVTTEWRLHKCKSCNYTGVTPVTI